ncbi:MAG: hypothetical protein KGI48_14585 [Hyphomicrobiales bacterium]|nr:hypothetical protein [Hyphomicrobiales bacterium]
MHRRLIEALLLCGLAFAAAGPIAAQQKQPPAGQPSIMDDEEDTVPASPPPQSAHSSRVRTRMAAPAADNPDLDVEDELAPSQIRQPIPPAVAMPTGGEKRMRSASHNMEAVPEEPATRRATRLAKPDVVGCNGVFGRDSSHAKLAKTYRSRNVAFTQVDAASGARVMASVLFAKDPKRRLEVWWSKPATRTDTHLIVINGRSDWIAPGEIRLGLTLAELEKLNGKPFKLLGFNKDRVATLSDWNGGQLAVLPGGCKLGLSLRADPKTSASALAAAPADRAFSSGDSALQAANPTVSEILLAY